MPYEGAAIIAILSLGPADLPAIRDAMIEVYREAFAQPPYRRGDEDVREFAESLPRHATFAGFQAVVARSGSAGGVAGFAYGYTLAPGQWWYEQIAPLLPEPSATLDGAFLLTQLAVRPPLQGEGLGGRLHDALFAGIPHGRAVLSTRQGDSPARHLYARRGWQTLLSDVDFPGAGHPYLVLVRERPRKVSEPHRFAV